MRGGVGALYGRRTREGAYQPERLDSAQPAGVEYRLMKRKPGPRPTLGDLHRATPWLWVHCEKCRHNAPLACAVPVIRWGAGASSDVLRQRARGCVRPPRRHVAAPVGRSRRWLPAVPGRSSHPLRPWATFVLAMAHFLI